MKRLKIFGLLFFLVIFIFTVTACDNATSTTDDLDTETAALYTVTVNVTPEDAMVELNGIQKQAVEGIAIFENVEAGPYTITVTAEGYESQSSHLNVTDALSVDIQLQHHNTTPGDNDNDNDNDNGEPLPEPAAPPMEAGSADDFIQALNQKASSIMLTDDIYLDVRVRVNYHLEELDLNGNTIYLNGGPLVFQGDNTMVFDGNISSSENVINWSFSSINRNRTNWTPQESLEFSKSVLIDGANIEFDSVTFNVPVFDWYQNQSRPAEGLVIMESIFNDISVFVSNVTILDSEVNSRLGIENDAALLEDVVVNGPDGILYIASSATLNDITWEGNFAGMYVGKSLKWAVIAEDKNNHSNKAYVKAEPVLTNADINNNKDGMAWWAINYDKAILYVHGLVDIHSEYGRNGLTLVGTDYRDYGKTAGSYDGGHIYGDAVFSGSDVHFGWHTGDYLSAESQGSASYWSGIGYGNTHAIRSILDTKEKYVPKPVDEQAGKKNADRLTIHGPTFYADVQIFTPANKYISGGAPLADSVWLGNITFNETVHLWGDFTVIDRKTVVNNKEIKVRSGNIRRIAAETTATSILHYYDDEICIHDYDYNHRGTLIGGRIISDTKDKNVLVLGDNLRVEDVELNETLYNVILETTHLKDVDIKVGDRNPGTDRYVLGTRIWSADVHVWPNNTPILEDVMWTANTKLEVWNGSGIRFAGFIDNLGKIRFQEKTSVFFNDGVGFDQDIRSDHDVIITDLSERAKFEATFAEKDRWYFDRWKFDYMLTADWDLVESTWYELRLENTKGNVYTFLLDLRDLDAIDLNFTGGVLLSELLDSDAVVYSNATWSFGRDRFSNDILRHQYPHKFYSPFAGYDFNLRFTAVYPDGYYETDGVWRFDDKTFDLKVDAWGVNCCDQPRILFASDEQEINLVHKITELLTKDGYPKFPWLGTFDEM